MTNITLSVPNDVHAKMRRYPELRWSEVARKAIMERLEELERAEGLPLEIKVKGWRPAYRGRTNGIWPSDEPDPPKELMEKLEREYRKVR